MTGRGVLANPALAREIKGGPSLTKEELQNFHDVVYSSYCENMSGDRNVLFKMKELWFYMAPMLNESKKYAKKIKKCERCTVYENIVKEFFLSQSLIIS